MLPSGAEIRFLTRRNVVRRLLVAHTRSGWKGGPSVHHQAEQEVEADCLRRTDGPVPPNPINRAEIVSEAHKVNMHNVILH